MERPNNSPTDHCTCPIQPFRRIIAQYSSSALEQTVAQMTLPTDWVRGLGSNDPATVRTLYAAHFPAVRKYVLQNSGTPDDAQDVFQEAITVLWLTVKEGRFDTGAEKGPGGFLFRVSKNKWLDVVRSAAHKKMKLVHDDRDLERSEDRFDDVEEQLVRLRAIYERMDEKCRTVLDKFYFERMDLASIAVDMGVEEESIRTIKYRCMMKLRAFRQAIAGDDNNEVA
ncbi:MAG TPA: sigma-70 family RNA polymerase sigma factor [Flavobacteriales bacterium]|nr:sigma-70 family RNA polymerase sigma factor [Flavobacteriales bacterium]MBP8878729.1 sigma-70 family RNA polymerase sigma factor [Flavobacteriales bacterium]HQX00017.1 sigma-70 family RNA polymerase sigma factor [Flavobacteriales bacterium]